MQHGNKTMLNIDQPAAYGSWPHLLSEVKCK